MCFLPQECVLHAEQVQVWKIQTDIYMSVVFLLQHDPRNAPTTSSKIRVFNPQHCLIFVQPPTYQFPILQSVAGVPDVKAANHKSNFEHPVYLVVWFPG